MDAVRSWVENRWFRLLTAAAILLALLAISFWGFSLEDYRWWRKFGVVREGVLLRGPQPTASYLRYLHDKYGIKTTISLVSWKNLEDSPDSVAERELAAELGVRFVHMPLSIPRPEQVREFLEIVDDPRNCPVYLHCMAGTARTGMLAAVFRMERDGWSSQTAFDEMLAYDFIPDDPEHKEMVDFVLRYHCIARPGPAASPASGPGGARRNTSPQAHM